MKQKKEVMAMYEVIRDRLLLKKDQYGRITETDLELMLGKQFHVPKMFRHIIIDELLQLEYITTEENVWHHKHKRIFNVNGVCSA